MTAPAPSGGQSSWDRAGPYVKAGAELLSALGNYRSSQAANKKDPRAQNQSAYMDFANAINDQRQRAARTPGLEALMTQMAQRLGVNLPMQRAKELEIMPVSGKADPREQFANLYGGKYADQYYKDHEAWKTKESMKKMGKDPMDYYKRQIVPPQATANVLGRSMGLNARMG